MSMRFRSALFHVLYRGLVKPIFFAQDPESIHDRMGIVGERLGRSRIGRALIRICFGYTHHSLEQHLWGMHFSNPVGLAAGFDKEGTIHSILPSLGFGFAEVGTVTFGAYEGNPKPRLYRLPKSHGLVVYYGLKNSGAHAVAKYLKNQPKKIPQIISIGKTNCSRTADEAKGVDDYRSGLAVFEDAGVGDAYELNISCPNTFGGEPFTTPEKLRRLLETLEVQKNSKPIILKMPINLDWDAFRGLLDVAIQFRVHAVNIGNLNKDRNDPELKEKIPTHIKGALSGKPTWERSNDLISRTYAYCGQRMVIIGTGGIFSAADAYEKIKRGASLVELITGMIYEGPQLIGEITHGLVHLLARDGYSHISEAVGAYHRTMIDKMPKNS